MPDISEPGFGYPKSAYMDMRWAKILIGTAIGINHSSNRDWGYYSVISPASDAVSFTHAFYLAAGSYTMNVAGERWLANGKIDWYIDNVLVVSGQDWYQTYSELNVTQTATVTVPTSGQHTLKGVVNGQNAGSSGYQMRLNAISLS
jgi:hypothetical protein